MKVYSGFLIEPGVELCVLSALAICTRPFFFSKGFKITFIPKQNKTKKRKSIFYIYKTQRLSNPNTNTNTPLRFGASLLPLSLSLKSLSFFFFSDVYSSIVLLSSLSGTLGLSLSLSRPIPVYLCVCVCIYASDLFLILIFGRLRFSIFEFYFVGFSSIPDFASAFNAFLIMFLLIFLCCFLSFLFSFEKAVVGK